MVSVVIVQCKTNLFKIILTLRPASSRASLLNGRQKQSDKNRNYGNHNKQFNQSKSSSLALCTFHDSTIQEQMRCWLPTLARMIFNSEDSRYLTSSEFYNFP